jgi:hypothetical protein
MLNYVDNLVESKQEFLFQIKKHNQGTKSTFTSKMNLSFVPFWHKLQVEPHPETIQPFDLSESLVFE